MTTPTRRSALVFPEHFDIPPVHQANAQTQKDSGSVLAGQSFVTTPHASLSNSFFGVEADHNTTHIFDESIHDRVRWKKGPRVVINSWAYCLVSLAFIVFTLFGDGVRRLATRKDSDDVFSGLFLASFAFFTTDCLILFILRVEYRWSLSFWFDVFSTVTLLVDISWLWGGTLDGLSSSGKKVLTISGNASRIASRTLRLIKLVRLVRLLRVVKAPKEARDLMKLKSDSTLQERIDLLKKKRSFEKKMRMMQAGKRGRQSVPRMSTRHSKVSPDAEATTPISQGEGLKRQRTFNRLYQEKKADSFHEDHGYFDIPVESRVSKIISERTMKQVFCIVILSAFLLPYFLTETYTSTKTSYEYGLELLEAIRGSSDFVSMCHQYIQKHQRPDNLATLISLSYGSLIVWQAETTYDSLRTDERVIYRTQSLEAVFDLSTTTQLLAAIDISLIAFLCGMLLFSGLLVAHDFSTTVLFGVERMITLIKKIARNPLLLLSTSPTEKENAAESGCCCCRSSSELYGSYEMQLLEEALHKIGAMLALGLGTAGCEIITRNIRAAGRLDPLIPGKKVLAAFCFISIRGFDVLTDILGSNLLIYVNKVSKIVHASAERYQGSINRNLGEGYFAVWKFEEDDGVLKGNKLGVNPYSMSVRLRAALALVSCIKSLAKVARSSDMSDFLHRSGMHAVAPFLSEQLSVGLHIGWAFEGPVGSAFKIDATYLSPHVNKTARIESATRMYDVQLLASDDFVDRLDEEIKPFFRHIDTVVLKGTTDPIRLHTFDLALQGLGVSVHEVTKASVVAQRARVKEAFEYNYFNVHELFTKSEKIAKMRAGYTQAFLKSHQQAMQNYIEGRWLDAKDLFHRCLRLMPMDGPSLNILTFMEKFKFQHPEDWVGVRVLGSK